MPVSLPFAAPIIIISILSEILFAVSILVSCITISISNV